ncbi:MAG TPA: TetR/AcrR family transcriptional regulator [Iamia sp.]|nr:TetR/AcrR family transcriptional regulator [Iamia sp.]
MSGPAVDVDERRAARRASRREANRDQILDAAEKVFGRDGPQGGSLRNIAAESGFSTAAIYLFFDNKDDLLASTLLRRGTELIAVLTAETTAGQPPLATLHAIVDATIAFFGRHPDFRHLLAHLRGGPTIAGSVLAEFDQTTGGPFDDAMELIASTISAGQDAGEVRDGDARALAHLFSVLTNEHVLLDASQQTALTPHQFHALIDGAFRH